MYRVLLNWTVLFAQILYISAASLPSSSCPLSDSECLKSTAQSVVSVLTAGLPDIDAKVLDPLYMEKIKVDLAGLKLLIKDANATGLSKAVIDKVTVNTKKKNLQVKYHCDVQVKGKYKASGQLLILPISGDGDMEFNLKNIEVQLTVPYDIQTTEDNKQVLNLKKTFNLKYDVKDGAHFYLSNLFNGNKELSTAMLTFMNDNWKIITQEFGLPILDAAHKIITDSIGNYMLRQPIDLAS